jgi:oligopeptide/dipeptide ABC transporter ATP-binding protein
MSSEPPPSVGPSPLLCIERLVVDAGPREEPIRLLDGFDLSVGAGERVALVGESGSGKSVAARAVLRLDPALRLSGSVRLNGDELLTVPERAMRAVRGRRIGMVFQDPIGSLNPLMTIGAQVMEPILAMGVGRRAARARARALLDDLGVANSGARMKAYPHEFSGGMRQRVVLAMALSCEPELLIADEPTTALDVRVQEQVLQLLDQVSRERGLAVLLITHDLGIVAGFAQRVAVMYSGRKVHEDLVDPIFSTPVHPYTHGLIQAVPRIDVSVARLTAIPGSPPHPAARPSGCAFHPRCPRCTSNCREDVPVSRPTASGGTVMCHSPEQPDRAA